MRINLLPAEYRPKPPINPVNLVILLSSALALTLALGFVSYTFFEFYRLKGLVNELERELSIYEDQMAQVKRLESSLKAMEEEKAEVDQVKDMYQPQLAIFDNIAYYLPNDVWLEYLYIEPEGKISLGGKATSLGLIGNYLNRQNQSEIFTNSNLKKIDRSSAENIDTYTFDLELITERKSLEYQKRKK